MIPAQPGINAVFKHDPGVHRLPVVAWSDEGDALVVHAATGQLLPVQSFQRFSHLDVPSTSDRDPVQIMPGGGWSAEVAYNKGTSDEFHRVTPVIAWALCRDTVIRPVINCGDDEMEVLVEAGDDTFTVTPPEGLRTDCWSPPGTDQDGGAA